MKTVTLKISDGYLSRLRSEALVRVMANAGDVQDIVHHASIRIVRAGDGDVIELALKEDRKGGEE